MNQLNLMDRNCVGNNDESALINAINLGKLELEKLKQQRREDVNFDTQIMESLADNIQVWMLRKELLNVETETDVMSMYERLHESNTGIYDVESDDENEGDEYTLEGTENDE